MRAIVYTKYGPPDVLAMKEVEKPTPKDDEVLIRIYAASAQAFDSHHLRGTPFFFRILTGLLKPKIQILGADVAGCVEAVGRNVKRFRPGDEVYGDIGDHGCGAFAEYVCASEDIVELKPANLTFEEAAAVPMAAVTALQGLRDQGQIQPGHKVLINGASGGIGTFAVQIAKSFGAEVTGVCSTRNLDMVRSIGADHVIDYNQGDFTQNEQGYDLILDIAANRTASDYLRALCPTGICVIVGYSLRLLFQATSKGQRGSRSGSKRLVSLDAKANKEDLATMKELIETGKVTPVIDRRYPLGEVAEAIGYVEKGHSRGKVVIAVEHDE